MFNIEKNNKKIGDHLRKQIRKKYPSERQFCKAYLEKEHMDINDEEIRKMQNRFSQILNGKKAIQTHDLPVVTELLDISCEEILSAGKECVPTASHITNYSVAASKNPNVWRKHIERKDKLILNYDEYGNSILDYAFKFRNYELLKFLTDNGYITFRNTSEENYQYNFGADTTIARRKISDIDTLGSELGYTDKLRANMLKLAMENEDYSVLDMLHARETPMIFFAALYNNQDREPENYVYEDIAECIASAPDSVLDYFCTEYHILNQKTNNPPFFLYQHLGDVIRIMVKKGDPRVLKVINKAIEHNKKINKLLTKNLNETIKEVKKELPLETEEAKKMITLLPDFYKKCDVVKEQCYFKWNDIKTLTSNIIHANVKTNNVKISNALSELNASYERVRSKVDWRKK